MPAPQQPARTGANKRWTLLGALAALVLIAAVALYNCIPGFGRGSSGAGKGDPAAKPDAVKAEPAKPEPAKPEPAKPEPELPEPPDPEPPDPEAGGGAQLTVNIGVAGCSVAGSAPIECSKMCERTELFTGIDDAVLEVAGASHGSVVAMIDCLKSKGIDKVAIRRE